MAEHKLIIENKARGEIQFPVVEGELTITWGREGMPGKLICNIVKDDGLDYQEGNTVDFYVDDELFFHGYVFEKSRTGEQIIKTTCYDQVRYLKNKGTLQYEGWTYSQLLKNICADRHLQVGDIEDTKVVIPKRIEQNQEYYQMLKVASDYTTAHSNKIFVLFDKGGKINLKDINNLKSNDVIDYDCTLDFDYVTAINEGTYNRVHLKLLDDEDREVKSATAENQKSIAEWGVLSYFDQTNNQETDINAKAKEMLEYLNKKHRKLKLKNIVGRTDVRAGSLVPVDMPKIGDIDIKGYMLVNSVTHKFQEEHHFMDMEVFNKDISPQISPQKLEQRQKQGAGGFGTVAPYTGGNSIVKSASAYLGKKYVWGGTSTSGVDCSGLVVQAYKANGVNFPDRLTSSSLSSNPGRYGFKEINVKQAQPGDVMWNKGHVAIMYDGKNVIEASQSKGKTVIQTAWNRNKNFTRAFRYVGK